MGVALRPRFFNRVQVRAVRRQIKGRCTGITEQLAYRQDMMGHQMVHSHNITWPEGGNQSLFQIVQEFVRCCSARNIINAMVLSRRIEDNMAADFGVFSGA